MVSLDMLKETEVPSFLEHLFQVDGIVFASGFTFYELLPETKADQMDALWQVHLKHRYFCYRVCRRNWQKWKWPCRIYRISLWTSWKQHGDRL